MNVPVGDEVCPTPSGFGAEYGGAHASLPDSVEWADGHLTAAVCEGCGKRLKVSPREYFWTIDVFVIKETW